MGQLWNLVLDRIEGRPGSFDTSPLTVRKVFLSDGMFVPMW